MNALTYLFLIKLKASIRNLFSKVSSVIMIILASAFVIFIGYTMVTNGDTMSMLVNVKGLEGWMTLFCGYVLFMMSLMILQKRTAMVTKTDALYIFAGPFKRTQILGYLLVDTVSGSLFYAVLSALYVLIMMGSSSSVKISVSIVVLLVVCGLLMFYFTFGLITYFYFLEMVQPHARKWKIGVLVGFLGVIGLIFLRNLSSAGFGLEGAINTFVSDPLFSWIPIFGWCKVALIAFVQNQVGLMALGLLATVVVCAILTWMVLHVRGDFYEQAIQDAEWITTLRSEAKAKGFVSSQRKAKEVDGYRFSWGAGSIISKNFLQMRKSRQWISLQEIVMIVLYLGIAMMSKQSFSFYQYFILIVVFMSAATDRVIPDLKMFYIYLIPEKPLKKMLALVLPSFVKIMIITLISLVPCLFLFGIDLVSLLNAIVMNLSYGMLFLGACLVSLRILKSRTTVLMEQFIKMGIGMVFAIPGTLVMILMLFSGNAILSQLSVWGGFFTNSIFSLILIWIASGLFKGSNVMSD